MMKNSMMMLMLVMMLTNDEAEMNDDAAAAADDDAGNDSGMMMAMSLLIIMVTVSTTVTVATMMAKIEDDCLPSFDDDHVMMPIIAMTMVGRGRAIFSLQWIPQKAQTPKPPILRPSWSILYYKYIKEPTK